MDDEIGLMRKERERLRVDNSSQSGLISGSGGSSSLEFRVKKD